MGACHFLSIICTFLLLSSFAKVSASLTHPPHLERKPSRDAEPSDDELEHIQTSIISYNFTDPWLLRQAFWHPSLGEVNNARFAWIGDQVLGLLATEVIYKSSADTTLEDMTLARQKRVSRFACAAAAEALDLTQYLQLGVSFQGTEPTKNMEGELLEAVLGAMYQDSGFRLRPAQEFYDNRIVPSHGLSRAVA